MFGVVEMVFIGVDIAPFENGPTKGQNSFRAIELNRPFGFEIDLLNLQYRIPIIDSDHISFSEWPFCFDIMK